MTICKQRIEEFLRRDLGHWAGLPAGCGEGDVTSWLPFLEGSGVDRRGAEGVEYTFRVLPDTQLIVTVTVFPPCSIQDFRARYESSSLSREFGRPESGG